LKNVDDSIKKHSESFIGTFKALANEERLQIIQLLKKNKEMFAQDVERHFYLEQSTTSHHLNILRREGITSTRKDGRKVYYSLNEDALIAKLNVFTKLISDGDI